MVILGFAGFGWVLRGLGGFGLGGLVWGWVGFWRGLWVLGAGCVHTGQKGAFCGCFGGGLGCFGIGWDLNEKDCPIVENLSTLQNSQNFVNFHLSKNKGWDFKQSHP